MKLEPELLDLLICPVTGSTLFQTDFYLADLNQEHSYPILGNIPWLLPQPNNCLADWSVKLQHFSQTLNQEIHDLSIAIPHVLGNTQERLKRLQKGKQQFLQTVNELLQPILQHQPSELYVYQSLAGKAPSTQNLLSYEANLYRDWVWGEQENTLTMDLVLEKFSSKTAENFLVLGAGACKLAVDIHQAIQPKITVATDINPLLLLAAEKLLRTGSLEITEFPLAPRRSEWVAVEHQVQAEQKSENFHLLFADATKPALKPGSFDAVLTPWFIDIQPLECSQFLQQLNQYLPIGGQWINVGSLVFYQNRDAFCYSIEEVKTLAEHQGFAIEELTEHTIPYLNSPYNAGYRMEHVWCWRAIKVRDVAALETVETLPNWLLNWNLAIPKSDWVQQALLNHRFQAQLAAEVDHRTSIHKIAKKLSRQHSIQLDEALSLVQQFFLELYRQNQ